MVSFPVKFKKILFDNRQLISKLLKQKRAWMYSKPLFYLVGRMRFERMTTALKVRCSTG